MPKIQRAPAAAAAAASRLIEAITTNVANLNTTTETDLLSVTIPANTLGTGNAVRVRLFFEYFSTNTGNGNSTLRYKYGGTTVITVTIIEDDTGSSKGWIDFVLKASGATNTQEGNADTVFLRENGGADTSLFGAYQSDTGVATEDSTTALTLAISAQNSTASAGDGFGTSGAIVEALIV